MKICTPRIFTYHEARQKAKALWYMNIRGCTYLMSHIYPLYISEYESIDYMYIKAWYVWADTCTILYHGTFVHEMYGTYFVTYNTVAYHVLIQSAHHSHCISF